jgi:hypothetical protein
MKLDDRTVVQNEQRHLFAKTYFCKDRKNPFDQIHTLSSGANLMHRCPVVLLDLLPIARGVLMRQW